MMLNNQVKQSSEVTVEDILLLSSRLTVEERVQLVRRLLGSVTPENAQMHDGNIMQVNALARQQLGDILEAIANRVASGEV